MAKKSTVWLSYDLGVRGDYDGLYSWLDNHGAKECVESMAVVTYSHTGALVERIKADLSDAVEIDKRTRIYLVYRDAESGKNKGLFLFGSRRAAPWAGFAGGGGGQTDSEA